MRHDFLSNRRKIRPFTCNLQMRRASDILSSSKLIRFQINCFHKTISRGLIIPPEDPTTGSYVPSAQVVPSRFAESGKKSGFLSATHLLYDRASVHRGHNFMSLRYVTSVPLIAAKFLHTQERKASLSV